MYVASTCIFILLLIALLVGIECSFEKILDYIFEQSPWIITPLFVLLGIILVVAVIKILYRDYKRNPEETIKKIKKALKKVLFGIIILGFMIVLTLISFSSL